MEGASSVGGGGDELGERGQAVEEVLCSLLGHIALVGTKQRDGRSGDLLRTCC